MLNSHTLDTIKERNKKEVTMDYKIKGDSDMREFNTCS